MMENMSSKEMFKASMNEISIPLIGQNAAFSPEAVIIKSDFLLNRMISLGFVQRQSN